MKSDMRYSARLQRLAAALGLMVPNPRAQKLILTTVRGVEKIRGKELPNFTREDWECVEEYFALARIMEERKRPYLSQLAREIGLTRSALARRRANRKRKMTGCN